jgi:hypothetical protein
MTPTQLAIASLHAPDRWLDPPALASLAPAAQVRVTVTLACRDSDPIPKVRDAGRMFELDGERVQVMHDGTLVLADSYCGAWMSRIIAGRTHPLPRGLHPSRVDQRIGIDPRRLPGGAAGAGSGGPGRALGLGVVQWRRADRGQLRRPGSLAAAAADESRPR